MEHSAHFVFSLPRFRFRPLPDDRDRVSSSESSTSSSLWPFDEERGSSGKDDDLERPRRRVPEREELRLLCLRCDASRLRDLERRSRLDPLRDREVLRSRSRDRRRVGLGELGLDSRRAIGRCERETRLRGDHAFIGEQANSAPPDEYGLIRSN